MSPEKEKRKMYEHHKQSIQNLIDYFKSDKEVVAVILGGSVAKGLAREDSDIDAAVIVTQKKYNLLSAENRQAECIFGHCTYPGGYFDIKYYQKEFLVAAADHGSEPARNAFRCSSCLFSRDAEIPELVEKIPVFQKQEKAEKMLSFYSALHLNMEYFWNMSKNDLFLRTKAVSDIVFFGLRMLLQENEILFPCHKSLFLTVNAMEQKPAGILEKANRLLASPTDENKNDFVSTLLEFLEYQPPKDLAVILSQYIKDNELWWYQTRPVIAEW